MKHAGIGFPSGSIEKKRFNEISERLSQLSLKFNNNVLDATKAFKYVTEDKNELKGCSDSFLQILQKNSGNENEYCITLDYPIYGPFMMNCENRELREKVQIK
jgi:oligopeptidase A